MAIPRTNLNVSLAPELGQFIASRVTSGQLQTASRVAPAGLRLLEQVGGEVAKATSAAVEERY